MGTVHIKAALLLFQVSNNKLKYDMAERRRTTTTKMVVVSIKLALSHAYVQLPTPHPFGPLRWRQPHGVSNPQENEPLHPHGKHE